MNRFIVLLEIVLLLIIASILIFYQFGQIPKNLSFDEVEFAKLALSLDKKPYIPYSLQATGHSTLYFYIILLSLKILGVNNFALRLPSALFGVINVLLFYLIMKHVFQQHSNNSNIAIKQSRNLKFSNIQYLISNIHFFPFLLSFIFLTMRWYFNFARFSFEATFLLFLELTAIYFFFNYLRSKNTKDILFTGLFTGLAFNSYTPGRIFFLLPLIFLIIRTIKQYSNIAIKHLLLFLVPFLITILPLSFYLLTHQDLRVDQQFFLKNSKLSIQKKADFIRQNIIKTALMFNFKGDLNGRQNYPGKPALNLVLGAFFVPGLVLTLINIKNFYNRFFLVYFFISFIPTIFTYPWENPHMLRTFTVIPSIVYFIGQMFLFLKKYERKYILFLILFIIILSSLYEIRTYFLYQNRVFKQAFEMKENLSDILKIKK